MLVSDEDGVERFGIDAEQLEPLKGFLAAESRVDQQARARGGD
jgi:hypothetical protein